MYVEATLTEFVTVTPEYGCRVFGCNWIPVSKFLKSVLENFGGRDSTVVKVLCYKSEGRWFDPSWCQWNFSLT